MDSWKAFSSSCWLWKCFPCKSCWDTWRSGSGLVGEYDWWLNMTDEAKLCSPIHPMFKALVVWCAIKCCHGEELGPLCWPVPAAGLEILVHLIDLLSILLRCNGFTRIQKAVVGQMGRRPPNSDHDLFLGAGRLWEVLWGFSVQPLSWSLPLVLWNPLFITSQFEKWFVVV